MTTDRLFLLNRAAQVAEDGWIHIVPKGELANPAAGITQVIDDAALDSILRNLETDKARLGNRWPGLYVGREHFLYDDGKDSAALGWLRNFDKRADGLWADADGLTPPGRLAIANGEYKFTSFVADRKDTQPLGGNRARILRVDSVGFTNQANGKELLVPITNHREQTRVPAPPPAPAPARPRPCAGPAHKSPLGQRIHENVVKFVANRLKQDFRGVDQAHAIVAARNRDLFAGGYEAADTAKSFGRLTNRVQNRAGLMLSPAVARSVTDCAALTKRFMPALASYPTAMQWDALWRAADALEAAGIPERLVSNRDISTAKVMASRSETSPRANDVSSADWKAANGRADDVFALLDAEATKPVDRGPILENATAPRIRRVFRDALDRNMRENGMNRRQAFERLKLDEPIFWTLSMLSFSPEKL